MSRSKRKTPIISWACYHRSAQKKYRSQQNRAKRRYVKVKLETQDFDLLPHEKEYGNEWNSPRDGKNWYDKCDPKQMRK